MAQPSRLRLHAASPLAANKRAKHSGSSGKAPMDEASPSPCRQNSLGSAAPQSFIELLDMAGSDITFEVDGERICAHRSVLVAQSPYFREMFESSNAGTGSSTAGGAVLRVEASAGALRVLLRFLYTRALPESEDCGESLRPGESVRMAYRFQEHELYQHCLKVFSRGLRTDNVIERLVDAEESGPPALRSLITEWIESNTAAVKKDSKTFVGQLKFIPPSLAGTLCVELLQVLTCMELQIFVACLPEPGNAGGSAGGAGAGAGAGAE